MYACVFLFIVYQGNINIIETLRYKRPIVPREQRLCEFCNHNEIEEEYHMFFSCKIYADLRVTFLDKIRAILGIGPANKDEFTETILTLQIV